MTEEMKMKLFETMLNLEHLAEEDSGTYFDQVQGAWRMLKSIGLESEYIRWSIGK